MKPDSRLRAVAGTVAVAALLQATAAGAIDIWVTRYDDPAPDGCAPADCSLREAVIATYGTGTEDRIFLSAGTYELTRPGADEDASLTGDLDLFEHRVEIRGVAANLTTIDANGLDRIFDIYKDLLYSTVLLADLRLTGGAEGTAGTAIDDVIGDLTIERCEITGNVDLVPANGTIRVSNFGSLAMSDSTVTGNTGVGIQLLQSSASLVNVTVGGNTDQSVQVRVDSTLTCIHCTLYSSGTPAIDANDATTLVQLLNSAVLGSCVAAAPANLQTLGGNLESPGDTCELGSSDQINVANPILGGLAMNGGGTSTRLPGVASPLLGGAIDEFCAPADQRRAVRSGVNCDTGSTERVTARPPIPVFIDGFGQGDPEAWSTIVD